MRKARTIGAAMLQPMVRDLAIDLGTTTISILARGQGVILSEPAVLAREVETGEVVAVGDDAARMVGRTPEGLEAIRPLRGGAITDFESAEGMIRSFLHRVGVRRLNRPRVAVCVPSAITAVEQRAVRESVRAAGASEVRLLGYTMAGALGCGLPLDQPLGSMVVDIGGGTTEAAVVSLGGVVALESRKLGGLDLDLDIRDYVRRRHGLEISSGAAERVKIELGTASPPSYSPDRDGEATTTVRGRDRSSGAAGEVSLSMTEVADAIHERVMVMVDTVVACLGWTPPEIANDLIGSGIHLVGGGALLRGMAERISIEAKIPVVVADDPCQATVIGAGRCLGMFELASTDSSSTTTPAPSADQRSSGARARRSVRLAQVLGRLADLPVPVLSGGGQHPVDLRSVERGQGQHGPAADGGHVGGGGQDERQPPTQGSEGGHRRLTTQRVLVLGGLPPQCLHRLGPGLRLEVQLAEGEGRHLAEGRVGQALDQLRRQLGSGGRAGRELHRPVPDLVGTVVQRRGQAVGGERVQPVDRTQCGNPGFGLVMGQAGQRGREVTCMSSLGDDATNMCQNVYFSLTLQSGMLVPDADGAPDIKRKSVEQDWLGSAETEGFRIGNRTVLE